MSFWGGVLLFLFSLSISLNAFLLFWIKKTKKTKPRDYDAQALMQDLMAGNALVRVTRVAPQDVLLRSPRDRP